MMKLGAKFGMVCMAIFAVTAPVRVVAHEHHGYGAGEAGDSRRPARVVEIVMSDADGKMSYAPDHLEFSRGEQVKFVIRNQGALSHEFVLGSRSENHEHAVMMAAMPDMKHNDPNAKTVEPGKSVSLLWRFSRKGEFEFACLIPGHYESGMHGLVVVK